MSLSEIAHTIWVTRTSLDAAWNEWASISEEEKLRFVIKRRNLIGSQVGPVEPYLNMNTSGTTGVKKSYKFGPCGWAVQKLHERCALDAWDSRTVSLMSVVINHNKPGIEFLDVGMMPWHEKFFMLSVHRDSIPKIPEVLRARDGATALQPSPGVITKLLANGLDLKSLDPLKTFFVNTGEKPLPEERKLVLDAGLQFNDHMRCWDGGFTFYTCRYGHKHLVDLLFDWSIVDQELVTSDLFNAAQPFIDYKNGDKVNIRPSGDCKCGRGKVEIEFVDRKISVISIGKEQANYNQLLFGAMGCIGKITGKNPMDWYDSATSVSFAHNRQTVFMLFDGPTFEVDEGEFSKAMAEQTKLDAEFRIVYTRSNRSAYKTTKMFDATDQEARAWQNNCAGHYLFEKL